MSPLELVDDRFEKLAEELRASKPVAPASLRAQVRALEPPAPRWTFRWPSRRVVLGLAGAALLASFVAAGVTAFDRGSGSERQTAVTGRPEAAKTSTAEAGTQGDFYFRAQSSAPEIPDSARSLLPAASGRLQRYEATLRVRVTSVEALSTSVKRAMSLTRGLGGYVASVQYATGSGGRGDAALVLRVPVGSVQRELAQLTALGTILQQHTGILDVTRRADREAQQIARLERALRTATPAVAAGIRHRLATLRSKQARLLKSARFARITLGLTTPRKQAAAQPGRLGRTLDDAAAVLARELQILLYAVVVAGPVLLLGGAGVATARAARRRADRRLLERA